MADKKLIVDDLHVSFRTNQGLVRAVRGVSFDLDEGETLAIVGESGSGKSVTSRTIMGILAGNAIIDQGHIYYDNQDLTRIPEEDFHKIRGDRIGMIFQDPLSSLNPIMRIGKQITEGMLINGHHLKNMYRDLVHDEKMLWFRKKVKLENKTVAYKADLAKLKEQKASPEEVAAVKSAFKAEEAELKKEIAELKKVYKAKKPVAKKEVKSYWLEQKALFTEKINQLTQQIKQIPGESEDKNRIIEKPK